MAERNGELPIGETCYLLEPGETTLVCCNGLWGDRFSDMAERNGELPIGETCNLLEPGKQLWSAVMGCGENASLIWQREMVSYL